MDLKVETQPDPPKPSPKRPAPFRRLGYALSSEARRFWYRVTRENIAGFLWTLAWTIPITIFIWVYAESEQEIEKDGQPITITIVSNETNKTATIDQDEQTIMCDVKGPQANVENFKQSLSATAPLVVTLNTTQKPDGPDHISAFDNLRDNPGFTKYGVVLLKCNPAILRVNIDKRLELSLPVHRPAQAPANIPGLRNVTFDPPNVQVAGPSKIVQGMTEVEADLSGVPTTNQNGTIPVSAVPLIHDPAVTCNPATVKATLTIAEQDEKYTVHDLVIYFYLPAQWQNIYTIIVSNGNNTAPPFDVVGPPQEIDQISQLQKSGKIRAVLKINPENVTTTAQVPLEIEGLPADVNFVSGPPEVTFTATSRQ